MRDQVFRKIGNPFRALHRHAITGNLMPASGPLARRHDVPRPLSGRLWRRAANIRALKSRSEPRVSAERAARSQCRSGLGTQSRSADPARQVRGACPSA